MPALRAVILRALAALAMLPFVGASCGPAALGVMPGVLNDVHNLSLRKAILAYGTDRACAEVLSRSMPLKLREEEPVVGRFIPLACSSRALPGGDLELQFAGRGFVWTNLSLRVGFEAGSTVEYDPDFLMDGPTMYLYLRPRASAGAGFATRVVEQQQPGLFGAMFSQSANAMADRLGAQLMAGQLGRGFTVIRRADGMVELALGVVPPGQHPMPGIAGVDATKRVLVNERSLVQRNQRDYVPFDAPGEGRVRLTLFAGVDGAPAIDVLLVPRAVGDAWLVTYATQAATTPPPGPPLLDEAVAAGSLWQRSLDVPPGAYYLVLDHTETAGRTAPPGAVPGDRGALVSYGVQIE